MRLVFAAAFTFGPVAQSKAQDEAALSRVNDVYNRIEGQLQTMERRFYDASFAETEWNLGQVTAWADPATRLAKVVNELRIGQSTEVHEMWIQGEEILLVYERFEWYGNENKVEVNENRFYMSGNRVIREMSRSASLDQDGLEFDLSNVSHQINDDLDPEYAASLYETNVSKMKEIGRVGAALEMRPANSVALPELPYRFLFDTLSPDSRYALAWSMVGVPKPDWVAYQDNGYSYIEALNHPETKIHLVDLSSGATVGEIPTGYDPEGRLYSTAHWSPDGRVLVFQQDANWFTSFAEMYWVDPNGLQKEADLVSALSRLAMNELDKVDHPYTIDSKDAMGFIEVKKVTSEIRLELGYRIASKFEGDRFNAFPDMVLDYQAADGSFLVASATMPEYTPRPSTWQAFADNVMQNAAQWLSDPPRVADYLRIDTIFDHGAIHLYNEFGGQFGPEAFELLTRRPLFVSGPHNAATIDKWNRFEFGHYDPVSVAMISEEFQRLAGDPAFVSRTQVLYNAKFLPTARHYQAALRYWHENSAELEKQKEAYLGRIADKTLPEYGYQLENDLAWTQAQQYSSDIDEQVYFSTAMKFWVRRAADGTYQQFFNLLQKGLQAYDMAYYEESGLPLYLLDPVQPSTGGEVDLTMNEEGALGLSDQTPLNLAGLRRRLPGLEVQQVTLTEEGDEYPAFKVLSRGQEVLVVSDYGTGDPQAFSAISRNMRLPSGIGTGDSFSTVYGRQYPLGLEVALETDINAVIAEAPGSEHIVFYFRPPPGALGPRDPYSPPIEELSDFVLEEII